MTNIHPDQFEVTRYTLVDHVATITLDRPHRRNALNPRAYAELEAAFLHVQSDPEVRCVIVTGAEASFCSGEDVVEMLTGKGPTKSATLPRVRMPATPAAMAALNCDRPVIAAVNGPAVGWGMELSLFADIRIAADTAKFAELFIKRGLIADIGGMWRLPAIVGPSKAAELLFTGDVIDAAEALRIGLVTKVVPFADLMAEANAMAARIAANPPLALRYMKEGLRRTSYGDPHDIGGWAIETIFKLMGTADHREGVASFIEKRPAVFTGN
ncbi:enoyl-CoA hydratase [Polymorphobacter arshaanensis]|uniref:Enoyl-CoA hydratase n=1 Tax=Glacieibacterium arshaanense TaxID=2511025 RepID=A0A4Y9EMS6_9SPHN|nr:enoyl-CoA hydratase-related protein [Polymorphobacter arshaanensis]TFU03342.1 enoyl-CoA hydratase [Polymorphobacter arshaanensis]